MDAGQRRSIWQRGHADAGVRPPAAVPARADVLIVGAGITGMVTAVLMARSGRDVTVLEARQLGSGTTGRSSAKVTLLQGTMLSKIERMHGPQVARAYANANRAGQRWLAQFCREHGVAHQHRTAYTYATTDSGARRARRELEVARAAGLPVTWVDELELPFPTAGAVALQDQFQIDPQALLEALAAELVRCGGRLVEGTPARRVEPGLVKTDGTEITAGTTVIATNMPVTNRGGFVARALPGRSYQLALATELSGAGGMYLSCDSPTRSLRDAPGADGPLLLVGGESHVTGRAAAAARLEALRRWAGRYWPGAPEVTAWSAQDWTPASRLPYAGPVTPGDARLLVAGCYSKWGLANAVAASHRLAAYAARPGESLGIYDPWHPRRLLGLPAAVKMNVRTAARLAVDTMRVARAPDGEEKHDGGPPARSCPLSNRCTHLGGIVMWNAAEQSWDCPLHGSRFAADGTVLEGPATRPLPAPPTSGGRWSR